MSKLANAHEQGRLGELVSTAMSKTIKLPISIILNLNNKYSGIIMKLAIVILVGRYAKYTEKIWTRTSRHTTNFNLKIGV